jgi:hypothetical protein
MSRPPLRRIATLALCLILAASGPLAGKPQAGVTPKPAPSRLITIPSDFFSPLWSRLLSLWSQNGCSVDPYGRCLPSPVPAPPVHTEGGCRIDPYGQCLPGS